MTFGILSSQPGIKPLPLYWKPSVLTTGLPGKSLLLLFFVVHSPEGAPFSPPKHSEPSSCTTTCFFPVTPSPFCFTPPFPIYLNYPSIYHQLVFAPLAKHHKSWLKPFMMSHNPAFWPGEFHGQRSLAGYNPWSHKELDRTERLPLHFSSVRDLSSSSVLGQHIWGWML